MGFLQTVDNVVGGAISPFHRIMFGEVLVGTGAKFAHIDLVIRPKGSSVELAFVSSLASPAQGNTPFLAVVIPNLPPKPVTLMVNKFTMKNAAQAVIMFGPAQYAVAIAIRLLTQLKKAPSPKTKPRISRSLHPFSSNGMHRTRKKVHDWNYEATKLALRHAVNGESKVGKALARKNAAVQYYNITFFASLRTLLSSRSDYIAN